MKIHYKIHLFVIHFLKFVYRNSLPYMQKLLNNEDRNLKSLSNVNTYARETCHIDSITTDNLHYDKY